MAENFINLGAVGTILLAAYLGKNWGAAASIGAMTLVYVLVVVCSLTFAWELFRTVRMSAGTFDQPFVVGRSIINVLNRTSYWLQFVRVVSVHSEASLGVTPLIDPVSWMRVNFLSSYFLALAALGLGVLYFVLAQWPGSQHGTFGQLLLYPMGRALAAGFCGYLSISSLSIYFLGLISFISERKNNGLHIS